MWAPVTGILGGIRLMEGAQWNPCVVMHRLLPPQASGVLPTLDPGKRLHLIKYWTALPSLRWAASHSTPLVPPSLGTAGCCQPCSWGLGIVTDAFSTAGLTCTFFFTRDEQCPLLGRISDSFSALCLRDSRTLVINVGLFGSVFVGWFWVFWSLLMKLGIFCRNAEVKILIRSFQNLWGRKSKQNTQANQNKVLIFQQSFLPF